VPNEPPEFPALREHRRHRGVYEFMLVMLRRSCIVSTATNLSPSFTKRLTKRPFFLAGAVVTGACAFGLFLAGLQVQARTPPCVYCNPNAAVTMCYQGHTTIFNVSPATQCFYLQSGEATCGSCPLSDNANLSNLTLSAGAISPAFGASTTSYTLSVQNSTTNTTVTPTVADSNATVKVNGVTVASGSPSGAITLNAGDNTITTVVTAQDTTTTKTYMVTVPRIFAKITSVSRPDSGVSAGHFILTGLTLPNLTLSVQASPDLTTAFNNLNIVTADASGVFTYDDASSVGLGKAFYRVSLLENLLVNGNAEAGAFSATGAPVAVPGWTTSSAFTVVNYKPADDTSGFPKTTDAGPADRANQFLAGGNAVTSTATQTIDVSANAAEIDNGSAVIDLSGWLGGFATDGDNAALSVAFFNGSTNLGSGTIGPVTKADRGNVTSLLFRSQTIPVPASTRQLVVTLTMNRTDGAFNDGYADSLSVVLQ
jgi:hypothetical protein